MLGPPGETCRTCAATLAVDQRYCVECGTRRGAPRLDWKAMVMPPAPAPPSDPALRTGLELRLPSPRVAAALVLGTLAFGVVVGAAAGPGTDTAGAGGRRNLTILAAAPAAPAAAAPAPEAPAPPQAPASSDSAPAPAAAPAADPSPAPAPPPSASAPTEPSTLTGAGSDGSSGTTPAPQAAPKVPPVKHVWLVVLHGRSYAETFGDPAAAPYLAGELRAKGTLLPWYHATSHDPDAGGVALISGRRDGTGPFDAQVQTLPDQLTGAGKTWRAYLEDVAPGAGGCDRAPFSRFASITSAPECGPSVVGLDRLAPDLADAESAPAFSYISLPGAMGTDDRLRETVQPILDSPAYADAGLVVVTFDEGRADDVEAGGGRVGALLLSTFVAPGGTVQAPYDHFSLLRSVEQLFGLDPLGYAKDTRLKPFGPKVYAAWATP